MDASSFGPLLPFVDLSRLVRAVQPGVESDWADCLAECDFVGGPRVRALEDVLRHKLGARGAVACANGSDALIVGLQVLGVRPGMRVAIPNLTFVAPFEAIVALGATPVLVDVDPDDLQMSLDEFVRAHDQYRFEAAILVHLFGWASSRLSEFRAFCENRSIALLEDGAQAYGVLVDGQSVFSGARVATVSFYPAKVVGGAMDGGAILLRSLEDELVARRLCNHGRVEHYRHERVGWNSRMGGLAAAYLLRMMSMADAILGNRRASLDLYRERLAMQRGLRFYGPASNVVGNGYLCVATALEDAGSRIAAELLSVHRVGSARTYPMGLCDQEPAKLALAFGDLAASRGFCERVVNLPLFYGIEAAECERACSALASVLRER